MTATTPEQRRDALAAWLIEAEEVLRAMPETDPRYATGLSRWKERLHQYEELARKYKEE